MRRLNLLLGLCLLWLSLPGWSQGVNSPAEQAELRAYLDKAINHANSFSDRFEAEVWLLDMSTRLQPLLPDPGERLDILRSVHREASAAGLQPDLVLGLIEIESRFDRFAVSRSGAQGLMQVMPFWKDELGRPSDNLTEVDTNLRYGCHILQFYLQKEQGDLIRALARYNGSLGQIWYPELVLTAWERRWR